MHARPLLIISLVVSLAAPAFSGVDAVHKNRRVTPYGDFCSHVSHYGRHSPMIDMKQSEEALKHYYAEKGLMVEIIAREGRFLKAQVKDDQSIVDTIIFDRSTGRLRSIY